MKKTLAAVAVLGAFAGSALAANVTLYGIVDEGLAYTHVDPDTGAAKTDKLSLDSGIQSGSRWGLKGTEELGNGLTVGFILESGFAADSGNQAVSGKLFNRESSLSLSGDFGTIKAGRLGTFGQGTSSTGKVGAVSAFGTSYGSYVANVGSAMKNFGMQDNALVYSSPKFGGFQVSAMLGMGADGAENKPTTDRYYGLAAAYGNGPLNLLLLVESANYKSGDGTLVGDDGDDAITVTFGGNYDFEVVKVYGGVQYYDNVGPAFTFVAADTTTTPPTLASVKKNQTQLKGYALNLSLDAPILGGTGMFGVSYFDEESAGTMDRDAKGYTVSTGYTYNFSKRTNVYSVLSYQKLDNEYLDQKPSAVKAAVGLRHRF